MPKRWKLRTRQRTMTIWDSVNTDATVTVVSPLRQTGQHFVSIHDGERYIVRERKFSKKAQALSFARRWIKEHPNGRL